VAAAELFLSIDDVSGEADWRAGDAFFEGGDLTSAQTYLTRAGQAGEWRAWVSVGVTELALQNEDGAISAFYLAAAHGDILGYIKCSDQLLLNDRIVEAVSLLEGAKGWGLDGVGQRLGLALIRRGRKIDRGRVGALLSEPSEWRLPMKTLKLVSKWTRS